MIRYKRKMLFDSESYIFDLDNTLYSYNTNFFDLQLERMSIFIQNLVGINRLKANDIRDQYYKDFGTTMQGLIKNYGIEAKHFLDFIDDISLEKLSPNNDLINLMKKLIAGKKRLYVFTNSSLRHAYRVIKKLGLSNMFDKIVTLECSGLVPKPKTPSFSNFLNTCSLNPQKSTFFEDSFFNLVPAKKLGMKTVLVESEIDAIKNFENNIEIDYLVKDVISYFQGKFISFRKN